MFWGSLLCSLVVPCFINPTPVLEKGERHAPTSVPWVFFGYSLFNNTGARGTEKTLSDARWREARHFALTKFSKVSALLY